MNIKEENNRWLRVSLYYARNDWQKLLSGISIFTKELKNDVSNYIILFSQEKGENVRLAITATDSEKEIKLRSLIETHFASFISKNPSISDKVFEYGKLLWCNYENNSIVWNTYDITTVTGTETAYLGKTSSVILRLLEDDFSADNFYTVSLYLLAKILRNIASAKRVEVVKQVIVTYSVEFAQFGEYDFEASDLIDQFQINLSDVFEAIHTYWTESEDEELFLNEWKSVVSKMAEKDNSAYIMIDNIFYVLGLSLLERLFILELLRKWFQENRHEFT